MNEHDLAPEILYSDNHEVVGRNNNRLETTVMGHTAATDQSQGQPVAVIASAPGNIEHEYLADGGMPRDTLPFQLRDLQADADMGRVYKEALRYNGHN